MIYEIYRLNDNHIRKFCPYREGTVFLSDYNKIYAGELSDTDTKDVAICDLLFEIFNVDIPADFKQHSLSVSDVIKLRDKYYYCDSFSWTEVFNDEK